MPRIRRATATAGLEESEPGVTAVALNNNDGENRRILGASLSVLAYNDTLSSQFGIVGAWSTQAFTGDNEQQGVNMDSGFDARRAADEARAGPFLVVQASGRDNNEMANEATTDLGHPDNWIPWPDGSQTHLMCAGFSSAHNGGRAVGVLYYQEGAGGGL